MPQLLEALPQFFPPEKGKTTFSQTLSVQRALQVHAVHLDILCILPSESALRAACRADEYVLALRRKAPILTSSMEEHY